MRALQGVVVIGCGSIGLPIAAAFASTGLQVLGHDTDSNRLERLRARREALIEPDLATAVAAALDTGMLSFSETLAAAPPGPLAWIVTVPTPWSEDSGFDDSALSKAIEAVFSSAGPGDLLCIRSTVPIGTTAAMARLAAGRALAIDVAATPDRSVEGRSFREQFELPNLIGADSADSVARATKLFGRLGPVTPCQSPAEAEAAKLICNVSRDAIFGLANELARLCETMGLDGHAVSTAAARGYSRLGLPSPGPVGGPCLTKDSGLLLESPGAPDSAFLRAARQVNRVIPRHVAGIIAGHLATIGGRSVALLGIAFKGRPVVADVRGSVALEIAASLRLDPALRLVAWDPVVDSARLAEAGLEPAVSPVAAASGAATIVLVNDHPVFGQLDLTKLAEVADPQALFYDLAGHTLGQTITLLPGQRLRLLGGGERIAASQFVPVQ